MKLFELGAIRFCEHNLWERDLLITVTYDSLGRENSAILAFLGSPNKLEVYLSFHDVNLFIFNGKLKRMTENFEKNWQLYKYLKDFVKSNISAYE